MSKESKAFVDHVRVKMVESAVSLERAMSGLRKSAEESAKAFAAFSELDIDFGNLSYSSTRRGE